MVLELGCTTGQQASHGAAVACSGIMVMFALSERGEVATSDRPCPGPRPSPIAGFFLFFFFVREPRGQNAVWRRLSSMASRPAHHIHVHFSMLGGWVGGWIRGRK